MEIKVRKNKDNIYVIDLTGPLDLYSSTQLKDIIMNIIKSRVECCILDLKDVNNINSSGLGALIFVSSTLKKLSCPLIIVAPEGPVMQALEITRLRNYFTIVQSLEDAIPLAAAGFKKA